MGTRGGGREVKLTFFKVRKKKEQAKGALMALENQQKFNLEPNLEYLSKTPNQQRSVLKQNNYK